ncbi:MAG: Ig-like domain-containing protein [Microthrixaceae bacterium]
MSTEIETPATPSAGTSRRPLLRRALLVGGAVVALVVASIGVSGTSSAEPAPLEVEATAAPTEALVGATITVEGAITGFGIAATGEGVVAACGDVEATACGAFPTGTVAIEVDGADAGSTELQGEEDATFSWSTDELPVGVHEIVAVYEGDDWYGGAESAPMTVTITDPEPDPEPSAPGGSYGDASTTMTATAGGQVPVRGEGWMPETEVTVTMRSEPVVLGVAAVGAEGTFAQTYTIPAGTAVGAHTITLSGAGADGQPASVVLDLTVVAAGTPAARAAQAPSSLAFTG